jgi:hypothetical protein
MKTAAVRVGDFASDGFYNVGILLREIMQKMAQ